MARDKDKTPQNSTKTVNETSKKDDVKDAIIEEIEEAEDVKAKEDGNEKESGSDESVTISKAEFDQAREEIAKMKKDMDSAILDAQRIQAEFNNYRKRNATLRSDSIDDGVRETIKALLPVLDNFDRALQSGDESPFAKGIDQIRKQFFDVLVKNGLEEIPTDGGFDPNLHEAVMRDDEGDCESGTITAVLQKGYMIKGKIIRHTMVKVKA